MASFNKVLLMGNLTRDVELRALPSGNSVAQIGLAVNRSWTGQDGEKREEVTWVDCEAYGKTAEIMAKYLSKGRPVFIEGRLKLDTWQDKESGQNRSKMKVVVETFQFVGDRQGAGGGGGGGGEDAGAVQTPRSRPAPRGSSAPRPQTNDAPQMDPDDIPF